MIFDGAKGSAVHDFKGCRSGLGEGLDSGAGGEEVREEQERRGLERVVGDGVENCLSDEGQSSFGADEQVSEDVERLGVIEESVERVAGGVLHPVLGTDAPRQFGVGFDFASEAQELFA